MNLKTFELKGVLREEKGKRATKETRKEESIPCVLYGAELNDNIHFTVTEKDVKNLIYTPEVYLVKLAVAEKTYDAVIQEMQFHPVTDKLIHIDFLLVEENIPVKMDVPVKTSGNCEGVLAGGVLITYRRYLKIKALINDMPEKIELDTTKLNIGDKLKVKDLSFENLTLLDAPSETVIGVKSARAAKMMGASEPEDDEEATEEGEGTEEGAEAEKEG